MTSRRSLALAAAGACFLAACGGSNATVDLAFSVIDTRSSAIAQTQFFAIRNAADFAAFWSAHTANVTPPPAQPAVDFTREMVLAGVLGQRPNGCYGVTLRRVVNNGEKLRAEFAEITPVAGASCPAGVTNPSFVATVPLFATYPVEYVQVP